MKTKILFYLKDFPKEVVLDGSYDNEQLTQLTDSLRQTLATCDVATFQTENGVLIAKTNNIQGIHIKRSKINLELDIEVDSKTEDETTESKPIKKKFEKKEEKELDIEIDMTSNEEDDDIQIDESNLDESNDDEKELVEEVNKWQKIGAASNVTIE